MLLRLRWGENDFRENREQSHVKDLSADLFRGDYLNRSEVGPRFVGEGGPQAGEAADSASGQPDQTETRKPGLLL